MSNGMHGPRLDISLTFLSLFAVCILSVKQTAPILECGFDELLPEALPEADLYPERSMEESNKYVHDKLNSGVYKIGVALS